jgi:Domain of unknown function (DUF1902)
LQSSYRSATADRGDVPGLRTSTPFTALGIPERRSGWPQATTCPALANGFDTLDGLVEKLKVVIPELLQENGLLPADNSGAIPFAIIAEGYERAPIAA